MKKLTLAAVTLFCAPWVQADTVFGIYAGAGNWATSIEGNTGNPSISLKALGVEDHANNYYYLAVEHAIPFLPNIRLTQSDINTQQTATITRTFKLDSTTFSVGDNIKSDIDLSHTDATFYYEILDNWINIDLGITARTFKGYVQATSSSKSQKSVIDQTLPLAYGKTQVDLPFSGLSIGLEGNYIRYSNNKLSDYSAKVSYLFDSALDFGIELGYHKMSFIVDESDIRAEVNLKGPYAALIAHF